MKKSHIFPFLMLLTSLSFSQSQVSSFLSCAVTVVGSSNPTAPGLCNGTMTLSFSGCSNPPYTIQWMNAACQTPPGESAYTGATYTVNTLCGCSSQYGILIENSMGEQVFTAVSISDPAPTSLHELSNETGISVLPNPVNDLLKISLSNPEVDDVTMEIVTGLGEVVLSVPLLTNQSIDTQQLANGLYFIKFYIAKKQIAYQKIVIQK